MTAHWDALLLALASSTDNFMVGMTCTGELPLWANLTISFCNACGALVASQGGNWLSHHIPSWIAPGLAAGAFGYLALIELNDYLQRSRRPTKNQKQDHAPSLLTTSQVLQLAAPMTLNNLAGGVAGGAVGIKPWMTAAYACLASYVTMYVGHRFGRGLSSRKMLSLDPQLISASLMGLLCFMTFLEAAF